MAKIYKIEMYVVDVNDSEHIEEMLTLDNTDSDCLIKITKKEVVDYEWTDESPFNYENSTKEQLDNEFIKSVIKDHDNVFVVSCKQCNEAVIVKMEDIVNKQIIGDEIEGQIHFECNKCKTKYLGCISNNIQQNKTLFSFF